MCTNLRWIRNKYTDTKILVTCGHCKACLQEKANKRATRLKNELSSDKIALFVTLTYDRYSCPYILHDDVLAQKDSLPIYRDISVRRNPINGRFKRIFKRVEIDSAELVDYSYPTPYLPYLRKSSGHKVGVCLFSDVQDFNKRLRINLKRKYNYDGKYRVFNTFEYGSHTQRPHIHLLIYIEPRLLQTFKSAIVESWPFADRERTLSNIQIARDAASYVASYVNSGSKLPLFIAKNFPPKYSFSQGLGTGRDSFKLDSLLERVRRGSMSYDLKTTKDGVPCTVNLPIPKYVINRFFPLFKGYSRLTSTEISYLLNSVDRCGKIYESIKRIDDSRMRLLYHPELPTLKREHMIFWNIEDMFKIGTMLHNAYTRYKRSTGRSSYDFAIDYQAVWSCYKNTIIKRFMLDDEPLEYKYDNKLIDLVTPRRSARDRSLLDLYDRKDKTKDINSYVYSQYYIDV